MLTPTSGLPRARVPTWVALCILAAWAMVAAGCDSFKQVPAQSGSSGSSGTGPEETDDDTTVVPGAPCSPLSARCSDEVLQLCSEEGAWKPRQLCATGALCTPEGCAAPLCSPGDVACEGALLVGCNSNQDGWDTLKDCGNANLCDASKMACEACTPGQYSCNGAQLRVCNDEAAWVAKGRACDSRALCDAANAQCLPRECTAGETRCSGARFEQCSDSLDGWVMVDECVSDALCSLSGCKTLTCEQAEVRCDSNQLQACAPDQSGYVTLDTCEGPAFCNASAERCTESPCEALELQCNGRSLERCSEARDAWEPVEQCASATLCAESETGGFACIPPVCALDEYRCDGAGLQRCAQGRDRWEDVEQCATPKLCQVTAAAGLSQCREALCEADQYRCEAGGARLELCSEGRDAFELAAECSNNQCDAGRGVCAPCESGRFSCNDDRLERCDAGIGWVFQEQCAAAALCDAPFSRCITPECSEGAFKCEGQDLFSCDTAGRTWQLETRCAAGKTCDAVAGECDACVGGSAYCNADTRYVCNSSGSEYVAQPCGAGRCTEQGCLICTAGALSCTAALVLEECGPDGRVLSQRADCGAIGECQAGQGRCCTPNANLGCDGANTAVRVCGGTGLTVALTACDFGSLDTCEAGACTGCDPDLANYQCNGSGSHLQACLDGQFQDATACDLQCINGSPPEGAFCAPDCRPNEDRRCADSGESMQSCGDNGEWGAITPCAFGCIPSTQECAPQCRPGSRRCASTGNQPQLCDESGRWVADGAACASACMNGGCVDCLENADCPEAAAARCDAGFSCAACTAPGDCDHLGGLNACASGVCVECADDADCGAERCDAANGVCVECLSPSDCGSLTKPACGSDGACGPCQADGDCTGGAVCDTRPTSGTLGQCLDCLGDDDCAGHGDGRPFCAPGGTCFECVDAADCDPGELCGGTGSCVECLGDADCPDAAAASCVAGACQPCVASGACAHLTSTPVCAMGQCVACGVDADCNDGLPCNGTETCSGGVCAAGTPPDCNDGNPCTSDACNTAGCAHLAISNGTDCDGDNNVCNGGAECQAATCQALVAPDCASTTPCQVGSCDPVLGCQLAAAADGTSCDDGDPCNGPDSCASGACASGTATCDDGNPCTADACASGGCEHTAVTNGTACSDGDNCTTGTTCQAGLCSGGELPCEDNNPCTVESCTPATGACSSVAQPDSCSPEGVVLQCGVTGWEPADDCPALGQVCYAGACCAPQTDAGCLPGDCGTMGNPDGCGGIYDCPACPD